MTSNLTPKQISVLIDDFSKDAERLTPIEAENRMFHILIPLLSRDGYSILYNNTNMDSSIDYIAQKKDNDNNPYFTTGIQYKHYKMNRVVSSATVRELIGVSVINNYDRLILLANTRFTKDAWHISKRDLPVGIELIDIDALRSWTSRLERELTQDHSRVIKAITELSKELARIVAHNPDELAQIEWRDMERMLAAVFKGLGFAVELTPPSKDGGRDIILECTVSGNAKSYIVEIKHWRSGKRVGKKYVSSFVNVIACEKRQGGLYLSTYGYSDNAFEALTEIDKEIVRFGEEEKIVSLCRTFVKAETGIWKPQDLLPDLLFDKTAKAT